MSAILLIFAPFQAALHHGYLHVKYITDQA